jgi:Mg-chelatase subunit ChlD
MTVVTLSIPLLLSYLPFKKHRRSVPVYLYRASGGTIGRRIVQQLHPSSHSSLNRFGLVKAFPAQEEQKLHPTNILNIPLYASLNRLFQLIINKGPKVAENLKQLRAKHQKYEISLTQTIGIRKGNLIGKRVKAITSSRHGRYVYYRYPWKKPWDIALAPTIRAAAPRQSHQNNEKLRITIKPQDIRVKMRESYTPLTIVLLLDMSESMAASLENIRNAVLSMQDIASKKRDRVALVIFKGSGALVLQPPTTNLHLIEKKLLEIGTSDFTPLAAGMFQGWKVLRNEKMRNRDIIPILILISDGIVNIALDHPFTPFTRARFLNPAQADVIDIAGLLKREGIRTIVINTAHEETGKERPQYATKISAKTNKIWMDPTRLLLEIPRITGGYYYGVGEGGTIESAILIDAFTIVNRE